MKEIRRIDTGTASAPHDVLYAGGKLYFTAEGYKSIGRYDPAANKVEWMLGIGQDGTHLLVLGKDQQTMWVPNRGSNSISVIDGVMGGPPRYKVMAIPVPGLTPEGIDLSPDGSELWTATRGDGAVSIIDTSTRRVKQSFGLRLVDANRLKFTPDGSKVLILDGGTGTLTVLDAKTRKEIKQLKVADRDTGDGGVFVMPDGSRAYLGLRDDHSVVAIDLKTLEIASRWPMGADSGPGCINWAALKYWRCDCRVFSASRGSTAGLVAARRSRSCSRRASCAARRRRAALSAACRRVAASAARCPRTSGAGGWRNTD